jgi:MFS family permease
MMEQKILSEAKLLRGVFKTSIISFVVILALAIFDFTLPIFVENKVENFAIVGTIVSLIYVASLLTEIPIGLAVDKYGRTKIFLIATLALGLLGLIYFLTENIIIIAFLSFIFGVVSVAFWIPSTVLIRDFSPRKMLSQAQGVYMSFTQIAWIIGPIFAGAVATSFSVKYNFIFLVLFMFLAIAFAIIIFKGKEFKTFKKQGKGHKHKARLSLIALLFKEYIKVHKHALPLYILSFSGYLWIAIEWAFVPIVCIEYFKLSEIAAGLVLSAMMIIEGLLYYSASFVMDKIGKKYIITAGFLILFSSAYFMFLATNPSIFILAAFFGAAALSWILPGTEALLTEIVPENLYGEMSGLFDTSKDFGLIVGPFIGGLLATYLVNPLTPFLIVAISAGGAALLAGWAFWPERKKAK